MTAMPAFVPPAPVPLAAPLSKWVGARRVLSDPLSMWTRRHFTDWVLSGESLLGHITIVSAPDAIRAFMVERSGNFGKDALQQRVLKPSLGEGLFTAEGAAWRMQRRALAGLFTPKTVASFVPAMAAAADATVDRWLAPGPRRRLLQVDREMTLLTLDALDRSIFSDGLGDNRSEVHRAQREYFLAIGNVDPLDLFGAPAWLPRLGRLRAAPVKRWFDGLVDRVVADRRTLIDADPAAAPRDLLTLLFEARDPETGEALSAAVIRDNVLTFLAAGTETTANTLSWALYLLSQDHAARDRIEAEVDALDGPLTAAQLPQLPWTRAVIDETLRLYPTAPLIQRMAIEADELHGVKIPAGSLVVYAPWVLHRHKQLWDDPEAFRPERFLPGARETIDRFAYLPFGAGPRVCIGSSFALQEAVVSLASIVRRARLTLLPGTIVMPEHRITLRPRGGLPMLVAAR